MNDMISQVERQLLQAKGLGLDDIEIGLEMLLGREIDYGEVFVQSMRGESFALEDGIVKEGSFGVEAGIGLRALAGERTGFAYSEDIRLDGLKQAATAARSIAVTNSARKAPGFKAVEAPSFYAAADPISSLTDEDKVELLRCIDQTARAQDDKVKEVTVRIAGNHESVLVMASDGTLAADIRPLVRLDVSVIVEHNGRHERGNAGGGGRRSLESLTLGDWTEHLAKEAVRMALVNLEAVDAPAGPMPVVLGPGWPGVLLHEAVGHGLEGDFNRKGSSAFSNRVGEQVASTLCTVVDDGTMEARRGSLSIDDEGTRTQVTTLIENGVLKGYMQDKLNARLMNVPATGNGRRQSYAHVPMPRMTNTYMLPGQDLPQDIIRSVKNGIYAVNFGGGSVDITSGRFVFSATEAYLIEDGTVTAPIRGATLVGSGPEVMTRISMVGNDLDLDGGVGVCGKDGQSVPVGVGQPTLKVDEIVVGGTST